MSSHPARKCEAGFTLVEVLVALSLSALVATLSYGALSAASQSVATTQANNQRINDVDMMWQLLQRDLQHVVAPLSVDGFSAKATGLGISGGVPDRSEGDSAHANTVLELVRSGWANPLKRQRSDLQWVGYEWTQGRLYRRFEPFFDGIEIAEVAPAQADQSNYYPRRRLLAEGVEQLRVEFLPAKARSLADSEWVASWSSAEHKARAPVAAKVSVTLTGMGEVSRLFYIPAGL